MPVERGDNPESRQPQPAYYQAARFERERLAKKAYFRAQEIIFHAPKVDLSAYRFLLNHISHVVVIGEPPPTELDRRLRKILATGQPTSLPSDILQLLVERRAQAAQHGEWVERHYRPGQPL